MFYCLSKNVYTATAKPATTTGYIWKHLIVLFANHDDRFLLLTNICSEDNHDSKNSEVRIHNNHLYFSEKQEERVFAVTNILYTVVDEDIIEILTCVYRKIVSFTNINLDNCVKIVNTMARVCSIIT